MYQKEVKNLTQEVAADLRSSARSYYKIGIDIFHESRMRNWVVFQPALGNLSISVELLLKSIVAQKAIRMLYSNIPDEAQLLLCYPEALTTEHNSKAYLSDMKSFSYKSIEFDKAVSLFYLFFPNLKQEYRQFFSTISPIRNISVHSSVPDFQRYELERMAYYATKLFLNISELKEFKHFSFAPENKTKDFLKYYEEGKIKKVKSSLDKARENVKKGNISEQEWWNDDWETMQVTCPVCGNTGAYVGETVESRDEDGISLEFQCESFSCDACGLNLEDYEELELASMDTTLDRENDVDLWVEEQDYYEEYRW